MAPSECPTPLPVSFSRSVPPRAVSRVRRGLAAGIAIVAGLGVVGALAIRFVPSFGPFVGDSLRSLVGVDNTIALEEAAADAEDRLQQFASEISPSAPRDSAQALAVRVAPSAGESPGFSPVPVAPMHAEVTAEGDGKWVPIKAESERPGDAPRMFLTLLHPDAHRGYAELFVIALDARRVKLHAVAGTEEPLNQTPDAEHYARSGLVGERDRDALLAVFNGGFKTVHGKFGMQVDGVTLVPARDSACTVGVAGDGHVAIGSWSSREIGATSWQFWRQTPACLFEHGKMHGGLQTDSTRAWGAALKGDTVIRRSAIGTSADGRTIYFGLGNALTARALAEGMHHAGADDVAQLDINFSYPKFVLFEKKASGALEAKSLLAGFVVRAGDYVRTPNTRDFFYLTAAN